MDLHEKIYYCRKKAGLSQEALAAQVGVSRQAVSKWETGEAVPEISKLPALSKIFSVSTDWLLSDAPPQSEFEPTEPKHKTSAVSSAPSWLENAPGALGRLLRKYGWLSGVYVAVIGLLITVMGIFVKVSVRNMFGSIFGGDVIYVDGVAVHGADDIFAQGMRMSNPVDGAATLFIIIGAVLILGGGALAFWLKWRTRGDNSDDHSDK